MSVNFLYLAELEELEREQKATLFWSGGRKILTAVIASTCVEWNSCSVGQHPVFEGGLSWSLDSINLKL